MLIFSEAAGTAEVLKLPDCQTHDSQGKGHVQGCLQLVAGSLTSLVDSHSYPVPSASQVLRDKTPACIFKSSKNLQCWLIFPKVIPHSHSVSLFAQRPILDITFSIRMGFLGGSDGKEFSCSAGDLGSIPGLGRSPGEGNS